MIVALVAGAAIAAMNIKVARLRNLALAVGIPAATYIVAGVIAPFYVTTFVVRPNELVRESPYIREQHSNSRGRHSTSIMWKKYRSSRGLTNAVFDPADHMRDPRQYSSVGLAGAAIDSASGPGNSNVLRFSRHRRRSLQHQRKAPGDDARRRANSP